jgi:hypothetical protein
LMTAYIAPPSLQANPDYTGEPRGPSTPQNDAILGS